MNRILNAIDAGEVSEVELAQLHNFTMCALMLLSKIEARTWDGVIKEAEIAAWVKGEIHDMFMDEEVVNESNLSA